MLQGRVNAELSGEDITVDRIVRASVVQTATNPGEVDARSAH